jgi:hypothetical protein
MQAMETDVLYDFLLIVWYLEGHSSLLVLDLGSQTL